jgi:hypothetical protein
MTEREDANENGKSCPVAYSGDVGQRRSEATLVVFLP